MTPVKAINHIGIAVRSIEALRPFYEGTLGAVFEGIEDVPDQKVRAGFFRIGDVRLELLEPTDPSSTVATFLDKRGVIRARFEGIFPLADVNGPAPPRFDDKDRRAFGQRGRRPCDEGL